MDFTHPHFAEPQWLWVAVALPLAILGLRRYAAWRRDRQVRQFAAPERVGEMLATCHPGRRRLKSLYLVAAGVLMGIALARPQWGEQVEQLASWGEDVLFMLDTSQSMLTADVKPNRLIRAKLAMLDFARHQGRGRFGLLVFAGQAFLQCPLTYDHDAFRESLLAVDEKAIPVAGTDIGRALDEAMASLETNERRKVIVLVTDGEDLEAGAGAMAAKIAEKKVTIYTVGVGTEAGGTISIVNAQGVPELVQDPKGAPVVSRLDAKTLEEIARATGGRFFPLGPYGEGMTRVGDAIKSSLNTSASVLRRKLGVERFHWFLGALTGLLIVESLTGERRKPARAARGAPGPLPGAPSLAVGLLFLASAGMGFGQVTGAVKVATSEAQSATNEVKSATNEENANRTPREFYNAGTAKLGQGKLPEAEGLLQGAAASQRPEIQSRAIYNLGHVRFRMGVEALKQEPEPPQLRDQAGTASVLSTQAIQVADAALANPTLPALLAAYQHGRGVRKQLKAATEAVKKALEVYGGALVRWERSSSDFKSVAEMAPADRDAEFNAEVMDRHIAALVDQINDLQAMMPKLGDQQQKLKQRLKELKDKLGKGPKPDGEEEDDEDDEKVKEPKKGQKEGPNKEGKQRMMSREEAMRWLDALRLDAERKLPLAQPQAGPPGVRNGRNW